MEQPGLDVSEVRVPGKASNMNSPREDESCTFCRIISAQTDAAYRVFEDEHTLAFLDHRPLFPGHCLLVPKTHLETIADLPDALIATLFSNTRLLAGAIQQAMDAEGTFLAANNRISQSVPHFHVHIVPRRKGDGLKGFFWPRRKYRDAEEIGSVVGKIKAAIFQAQARAKRHQT
jgi:histidine triad (HIT) family protein